MLFTRIQEAFDGARITCFSESFDHCLKFLRGKQLLVDNDHGTFCDVLSGVMENSCYVSKEVDNSENEDGASKSDDQPEADTEENENQSFKSKNYNDFQDSPNGIKELTDLKNIMVFYDEKGNFSMTGDLSYIELMKSSFENVPSGLADENITKERWMNNRSAYTTQ